MKKLYFILISIVLTFSFCKKDDNPDLLENNYFYFNQEQYATPNALLINQGSYFTISVFQVLLTDGIYENSSNTIKNYNQILLIELNTELNDTIPIGDFTELTDETRVPNSFSTAKFTLARQDTILYAKEGLVSISGSDSLYRIDYSFSITDDEKILGKFLGKLIKAELPL